MKQRFFKVIACEIAFREISHCAARCPHLLELEFLSQGLHDFPQRNLGRIQERIDAVPAGRYEAILVGYALCGNLIAGLEARHTPLVVPRAHDCIAFFLGSRARHAQLVEENVGTYYYTSGWLECLQRRGEKTGPEDAMYLPSRAGMMGHQQEQYLQWVEKYGEEKAQFLLQQLDGWRSHYDTGALIEFDFTRPLKLDTRVRDICSRRGWQFREIPGDLGLLDRWLGGDWAADDFLIVPPGHKLVASYDDRVMVASPADPGRTGAT